jgi:hypothetical protein
MLLGFKRGISSRIFKNYYFLNKASGRFINLEVLAVILIYRKHRVKAFFPPF